MAEVNSIVIKKTQEKLGKFVKKPPLTEKLLKKPPFRFLHDIIIAIIKSTSFFNELLLPEEFDSTNIKDRDTKIAFLQKIIDVVKLTTNVELDVKPSKIVAGLEPEKTNQLLQAIGTALEKKLDSSTAVATVKNGNVQNVLESRKSFKKPNEITKESNKNIRNSKEKGIEMKVKSQIDKTDKKISTSKKLPKEKPKENIAKVPIKQITVSKNKLIEKVESRDIENEKENLLKDNVNLTEINADNTPVVQANEIASTVVTTKNIENQLKNSDIEEPDLPITEDAPSNIKVTTKTIETRKEILDVSNVVPISNDILLVTKENDIRPEDVQNDRTVNSETNILHKERRKSRSEEKIKPEINQINNETIKFVIPKSPKHVVNNNEINAVKNEEEKEYVSNVSNEKLEKPELIQNKSFVIQKDDTGKTNSRPRTSLRPPSVRPASARPGAPRRRDKNIEIMLQPKEIINMAGINIKIEQFSTELEDDGENLVIIENQDILNGMDNDDVTAATAAGGITLDDQDINNVQKGHLVQQILETQKEFSTIDSELNDIHKTEDSTTIRENQTSAIQMDTLRELLQKLTRSVNPLGKLMDFLQEDIDSMQMELIMWRNFYQNGIGELNKAKSVISAVIEPFKHQLAQIESNIKEQMELINISRSNILQNEDTILKLLNEL